MSYSLETFYSTSISVRTPHAFLKIPPKAHTGIKTASLFYVGFITVTAVDGPCFGVKGFSPLSNIMPVHNVPFDSMHLLYLGITRTLLLKIVSRMNEHALSSSLVNISVPSSFTRKPRSLLHKAKFKATKRKNVILYFVPLFMDHHDVTVKKLTFLLSTVIHNHSYESNYFS